MTQSDSTTQSSSDPGQTFPAPSGQVTLVLDAPRQSITPSSLPANFRTTQSIPNISGVASGSAEFSASQFQAMLAKIGQTTAGFPLVVVDLRQEPHGFLELQQPLNGETEIAVGWFVERDWLNVAKGTASILVDEDARLAGAAQTANLAVYNVLTKTPDEDGIATATKDPVQPTGTYKSEATFVQQFSNVGYLRLPTTDHCRPRDSEVDHFVAYDASYASKTWFHFHCRAGDGRTTTFMVMHDIINNAPGDSLQTILTRQGPLGIGGIDLSKLPTNQASFSYPFSVERVEFVQNFYKYVCAAKPGGFKLTWSDWVTQNPTEKQVSASA